MQSLFRSIFAIILLFAGLVACTPTSGAVPDPNQSTHSPTHAVPDLPETVPSPTYTPSVANPTNPLAGTSWVLEEMGGAPLLVGAEITLSFTDTEMRGYNSCGDYAMSYIAYPDRTLVISSSGEFGPDCTESEANSQRYDYFKYLGNSKIYEITADGQLIIGDERADRFLTFTNTGNPPIVGTAAPATPNDLAGTTWYFFSLNGQPLELAGGTLTFHDSSRLSLSGSCTSPPLTARYTLENGGFHFVQYDDGNAYAVCEMIEPPEVSEQYSLISSAFHNATRYELQGDQLRFYGETGDVLIFTTIPRTHMNPADLLGTWILSSIHRIVPLSDGMSLSTLDRVPEGITAPTLTFVDATTFTGFAGCREYTGTYSADGDLMTLDTLTLLSETCADETARLFEDDFISILRASTQYEIDTYEANQETKLHIIISPNEVGMFFTRIE